MKHHITSSKPGISEREVTINILQNKDEDWVAELYTNIHKYCTKCLRQGWTQTSETLHKDGTWISATFIAPAKAISIGKAIKVKRQMTEEQKQAAKERMQKWHEQKQQKEGVE